MRSSEVRKFKEKVIFKIIKKSASKRNKTHEEKVAAFYSRGARKRALEAEGFLSFGYWNENTNSYKEAAENLVQFFIARSGIKAVGDFFISVFGMFKTAVCVFFFMQIVYIIRHSRGFQINKKEIISGIFILGPLSGVLIVVSPMLIKAGIFLPVFVYSLALMISVWIGIGNIWRKFYPRTIDWIIAIAMIFFFIL